MTDSTDQRHPMTGNRMDPGRDTGFERGPEAGPAGADHDDVELVRLVLGHL